jgi:hypothetical protein
VITGFNTDIEHDGVVYHVQTEDKGLDSPLILSLVYAGGAILASKRSRYEDLIEAGFDEEALAQRLKRQHRLICAAINAGRIDDLKKMGARVEEKVEAVTEVVVEPEIVENAAEDASEVSDETVEIVAEAPAEASEDEAPVTEDIQELMVSNASDYAALAESAPPPLAPPIPVEPEPLPVEVIAPEADIAAYTIHDSRRPSPLGPPPLLEQGVVVSILDEEEFRAGQIFNIRVMVEHRSGTTAKPLASVPLSVKILGTTFRPQLYSVRTGKDGVAVISAQIPRFTSGRAAILIRADTEGKAIETRRVIHAAL